MSRGLGRVERAILDEMQKHPNGSFTTMELCEIAYESRHYNECCGINHDIPKKERVAVLRAVRRLIERAKVDPAMLYVRSHHRRRRGGEVVLFNAASAASYSRASQASPDSQWLKFDMQIFDAERHGDAERLAEIKAKKAATQNAYMAMVIRR
jgi:hypothetical protein